MRKVAEHRRGRRKKIAKQPHAKNEIYPVVQERGRAQVKVAGVASLVRATPARYGCAAQEP